jgi:CheY-like chemotaxis protein
VAPILEPVVFNFFAKPPELRLRRVLIIDPQPHSARALGELLRRPGGPEIWGAPSVARALRQAAKIDPDVIFCELVAEKLDGGAFTRALRRSDLACRKAPVILVTADVCDQAVLAARDAGAHELLRRPILAKDLARRVEAAVHLQRDWVESMDYVGPDRRRFNSADFAGPLKRLADQPAIPAGVRIGEALKIVRSALGALEADPAQARRALTAQVAILQAAAAEASDTRLTAAVEPLARYLAEAEIALVPEEADRFSADLLAYAGRPGRIAA